MFRGYLKKLCTSSAKFKFLGFLRSFEFGLFVLCQFAVGVIPLKLAIAFIAESTGGES
jgi:hypothetical protein